MALTNLIHYDRPTWDWTNSSLNLQMGDPKIESRIGRVYGNFPGDFGPTADSF